ncbi:MAG: hypothetical protein WC055_00975 [Melioribacteraceae bacterium]
MKSRNYFVSNSSSSSFVCEICSATESGWDASPEDLGFAECVNGHVICDEHLLNEDQSENGWGDSCYSESSCPICQFKEISYPGIAKYLLETYGIDRDIVFEKIKEVNKRRKKLYDHEYVEYVFKEKGLNDETMLNDLKNNFGTYSNFINRKQIN